MSAKKIIFLHIPKAGGTTLHSVLERCYSKENIFDIYVSGDTLSSDQFIALTPDRKERISLLKGHMYFGLHQYFHEAQTKYISFLRHPVERIVSLYKYILSKKDHYLHDKVVNTNLSLDAFVESDLTTEIDNGQTRLISGVENLGINRCTQDLVDTALKNISEHFAFIGITEKFDESLICMVKILEFKIIPFYRKLNTSKNVELKIKSETIKVIEERNRLDLQLYNISYNQLSWYKNSINNFDSELKILQNSNMAFSQGFFEGENFGYSNGFKKGIAFEQSNNFTNKLSRHLFPWIQKSK